MIRPLSVMHISDEKAAYIFSKNLKMGHVTMVMLLSRVVSHPWLALATASITRQT